MAVVSRSVPSGAQISIIDLATASVAANLGSDFDAGLSVYLPQLRWLDSERLLVHLGFSNFAVLNSDGKHFRWLPVGGNKFAATPKSDSLGLARIAALPPADPDFVYVVGYESFAQIGEKREARIVKFHLKTSDFESVWREKLVGRVIVDQQGRARVWHEIRKDAERFYLRDPGGKSGAWVSLDAAAGRMGDPEFALSAENYFARHTTPLAFTRDTETLLIASNVGRETVGIYGFNPGTGRRTGFALEHPGFDLAELHNSALFDDSDLVFDPVSGRLAGVRYDGERRTAIWADEELREVQLKIEALAPAHGVQIENWDTARESFLVLLSNRVDAGTYGIYTASTNRLRTFLTLRPPHPTTPSVHVTPWKLTRADGSILSGHLTMPLKPSSKPIPVIAYFQPRPWMRIPAGYSPHVAMLAMMGYAVVEVNHRGIVGLGASHWLAGRPAPDTIAARDMFEGIDHVAGRAGLEVTRVAVAGARFGGLLAIRAAQIAPERVACVVAIDPETDLTAWEAPRDLSAEQSGLTHSAQRTFFGPTRELLGQRSPISHVNLLSPPVMLAVTSPTYAGQSKALRGKMSAAGRAPEWLDTGGRGARSMHEGGAGVAIEDFLHKHLAVHNP